LNTITHLQNNHGNSINGHSNLEELNVEHFQNLFHDDNQVSMAQLINIINIFPSYVTDGHNLSLQEVISEAEVDEAITSMQRDKSPSPNGFPIEFYNMFIDLLKSDITGVVEEARASNHTLATFNSMFITLIPKVASPSSMNDFRPISLCNCIYNIIAKVITRHIKGILSDAITRELFAFLSGRQIYYVISIMQEVLHTTKTHKYLASIIKLDISKAYDRVN
jgi:hypothetical protein